VKQSLRVTIKRESPEVNRGETIFTTLTTYKKVNAFSHRLIDFSDVGLWRKSS
jgi:hypothetical protein